MALTWTQHATATGYQIIKATVNNGVANSAVVVKNDGSILEGVADATSFTAIDQQYLSSSTLYVSIDDTVTDYATYFTNNPYTLDYELVKSVTEVIQVTGDLSIQGDAQVSVLEGGEFFESLTPDATGQATLANNAEKVLTVFDGVNDVDFTVVNANTIQITNYDSTQNYEANYIRVDKYNFTTNLNDVKATYNTSLKSSVNQTIAKQSDIATEVSIHDRQILDILIRLDAGGL